SEEPGRDGRKASRPFVLAGICPERREAEEKEMAEQEKLEEKTPETQGVGIETPAEPPEAEKPAPPTVESLQAEVEDLKRQRDRAAAAARRKAESELAAARTELEALKRKGAAGPEPVPPDPELGISDPAKYRQEMADYNRRFYDWKKAQEIPESTPESAPQPDAQLAELAQGFLDRAQPFREKYADFNEVVDQDIFNEAMRLAIFESERGPEIAYHLGKNLQEANRIAMLPTHQIFREIGRLEARFSAPASRAVSGAPPPITPVQGTAAAEKDLSKMSTEEFIARRNQEEREGIKKSLQG
ncbi:MAG: hypothetical protein ACE5JS_20785, partial [Nitrospinota bacterium]